MSEREEVLLEPGFVLHHRPYRNTSLLVECLTATHGRQALIAQGARRSDSGRRQALQPFRRMQLSWVRRGELGRLTHADPLGMAHELRGDQLLAGFYLNELLLRLVPRGDHNDAILSCYSSCLDRLVAAPSVAPAIRVFELELLDALGYRIDLDHDYRTGEPIAPDRDYVLAHEGGLTASEPGSAAERFRGLHVIALREHRLEDRDCLRTARQLLGSVLSWHLGERPLKTRQVMHDIMEWGFSG